MNKLMFITGDDTMKLYINQVNQAWVLKQEYNDPDINKDNFIVLSSTELKALKTKLEEIL